MLAALVTAAGASVPAAEAFDLGRFISEKLKILGGDEKGGSPRRIAPVPVAPGKKTGQPGGRAGIRSARVPLPRPRPPRPGGARRGAGDAAHAAIPPAAPLAVREGGRLDVAVDRLGRERDPYRSVTLAPKEKVGGWPAADVGAARQRCEVVLATTNLDARPLSSIGGPKGCGVAAPIEVSALGAVALKPPAKLNCTFAAALYRWVTDVVQPAARSHFGQPVVAIRQLSSYACRRRGGITRGPVRISEHAFGNAIDIGEFTLADGRRISVLRNWGGFTALFDRRAAFLREVHKKACGIFSTVLGPEANRAHRNHFHFDLGRGGRYKYCR